MENGISKGLCTGPYLQAVGLDALQHQPLKKGLAQPCPGSLLVDDDRPQLAVVPNQHSLLGSQDQGNERLWLCCLSGLIHQQLQVQYPCYCEQSEAAAYRLLNCSRINHTASLKCTRA